MAHILKQSDEVWNLIYQKSGKVIYDLLNSIALANWNKNTERELALTEELADMLSSTAAYSDMLGRRRVLLRADNIKLFNDEPEEVNPIIPNTPFQEAIDDLVKRMPMLAKSAEEVRQIYSVSNYFASAKSTSLNLTKRIQAEIAKALAKQRNEFLIDLRGIHHDSDDRTQINLLIQKWSK